MKIITYLLTLIFAKLRTFPLSMEHKHTKIYFCQFFVFSNPKTLTKQFNKKSGSQSTERNQKHVIFCFNILSKPLKGVVLQ